MKSPISFIEKNPKKKDDTIEISFNKFLTDDVSIIDVPPPVPPPKKPTRRKSKKQTKVINGREVVPVDEDLPLVYSKEPYVSTYDETNDLLKHTITQIDVLSSEIKSDLDIIRNSKTLKSKYTHIPNLANTLSSLMATKVTAIREIGNTLTNAHKLDLQRIKDLKLDNQADDDKYIMDMYNAFISAPVSGVRPDLVNVPMNELTMNTHNLNNIVRVDAGAADYNNYVSNITPVQRAMRYEHDSDVKTVVVFEQATGRKWFDVMNMRTMESIEGVPRPDPMFLEELTIDSANNIARDVNLNRIYPLIKVGAPAPEY